MSISEKYFVKIPGRRFYHGAFYYEILSGRIFSLISEVKAGKEPRWMKFRRNFCAIFFNPSNEVVFWRISKRSPGIFSEKIHGEISKSTEDFFHEFMRQNSGRITSGITEVNPRGVSKTIFK